VQGGKQRTIIWRFAPLSEMGGHANMILASGTDITELRGLEKSVRFREKLSSLGTLSAGIAHDFNNILTAIAGYSSLALDKVRGQGEVEEFIRNIERASNRATDLVARILSLTQIDEGQFKPLDISNALAETIGLLKGSLTPNITVSASYPDRAVLVNGDMTQIQQLIINLGTNAAQAIKGEQGELKFSLREQKLVSSELPLGSTLTPGNYVVLEVVDSSASKSIDCSSTTGSIMLLKAGSFRCMSIFLSSLNMCPTDCCSSDSNCCCLLSFLALATFLSLFLRETQIP
jgi:signal transduction histidine kinase